MIILTALRAYWPAIALLVVALGVYWAGSVAGAAGVQQKWDKAVSEQAAADSKAVSDANAKTEQIRKVLLDYTNGAKAETDKLERAVAAGTRRLRIVARCPASPTLPGRAGSGTAELGDSARQDYFDLRRGIIEQRGLLNFCRSELRQRSAQ